MMVQRKVNVSGDAFVTAFIYQISAKTVIQYFSMFLLKAKSS